MAYIPHLTLSGAAGRCWPSCMASFRRASSGAGRQAQAVLLLAVALLLAPWTKLRPPSDPRLASVRLAAAQGQASSPEQLAASEAATASEFDAFEDALSLSAQSSGGRGRSTKGGTGKATFMDADKLRLLQQGMLYIGGSPDAFPTCRFKDWPSWDPDRSSRRRPDCNAFVPTRPRDQQDCSTCVTEAIATAIQMSVAATLQEPTDNWEVSSQSLYYCSKGGRTCRAGWDIQEALNFLIDEDATLIRPATCLSSITQFNITDASTDLWKGVCDEARSAMANCDKANPTGMSLRCSYKSIGTFWQMQRHIRRHGAVITRIRIPSDFEDQFGANASLYHGEAFTPYRYNDTARGLYGHAVLIVGYNNTDRTWTVLNSWGDSSTRPNRTGVTKDGLYKIQMGLLAIGTPDLTYGVECEPAPDSPWSQQRDPHEMRPWKATKPVDIEPGGDPHDLDAPCYVYRFNSSNDTVSSIVDHFGLDMAAFVRDNKDLFPDQSISYPFVGKLLLQELQLVLDVAQKALSPGSSTQPVVRCTYFGPPGSQTEVVLNCTTDAADCMRLGTNGTVGCKLVYSAANVTSTLNDTTALRVCGISRPDNPGAFYSVARFDNIKASQQRALRDILQALGKSDVEVPKRYCKWALKPLLAVEGCDENDTWVTDIVVQDPSVDGINKAKPILASGALLPPLLRLERLQNVTINWLDGPLPPQLGALNRLTSVSIGYYCAWGGLPAYWLDGWETIQTLYVGPHEDSTTPELFAGQACGITGSVPERWNIANGSRSLKELRLPGNRLSGELPPLTTMAVLFRLDLNGNTFRGGLPPSWAKDLKRAFYIFLANNPGLAGLVPREWSSMAEGLSQLRLDNTAVAGCLPLEFKAGRVDVSSSGTNITGFCAMTAAERQQREADQAEAMTTALRKLLPSKKNGSASALMAEYFSTLQWYNDSLDWVASGPMGGTRHVGFAEFSSSVIIKLRWDVANGLLLVVYLYVQHAPFDLTHLGDFLSKMQQLEELHIIFGTPAKGLSAAQLPYDLAQRAGGRLQVLNIAYSGVTGTLPSQGWGRWSALRELRLPKNRLIGSLPPLWGRMRSLQRLDLSENKLEHRLPPEWGQMASLQDLDLSSNRLWGLLPPEWSSMRSLAPGDGTATRSTLNLGNNKGLTGPLPPEWGDSGSSMPDGITISVAGTGLAGTIPPSYKRFGELDLEFTGVTGCIPPGVNVLGLRLANCFNTERQAVEQLHDLLAVAYGANPALDAWLTPLGDDTAHCHNKVGIQCDADGLVTKVDLTVLRLEATRQTHFLDAASLFSALSGLPSLQTLVASGMRLAGPLLALPASRADGSSVSLDKLRVVDLSGNPQITGDLPSTWGALQDLQLVDVSGCSGISGGLPEDWAALQSLKVLRAANTGISGRLPPLYGLLKSLEELDVSGARLEGDPVPPAWVDVSKMEAVAAASGLHAAAPLLAAQTAAAAVVGNAASADITSSQEAVQSAASSGASPVLLLPRLRTLRLSSNRFSGSLLPELTGLQSLRTLDLSAANGDGNITGVLPLQWAAMSKLQELSLAGQKLSGGLPVVWSLLSKLTSLNLARNQLAGTLPPPWSAMKRLKVLDLSANAGLTGRVPPIWLQLKWCSRMRLNGTSVTGC